MPVPSQAVCGSYSLASSLRVRDSGRKHAAVSDGHQLQPASERTQHNTQPGVSCELKSCSDRHWHWQHAALGIQGPREVPNMLLSSPPATAHSVARLLVLAEAETAGASGSWLTGSLTLMSCAAGVLQVRLGDITIALHRPSRGQSPPSSRRPRESSSSSIGRFLAA